ncbi:hypothetical protein LY76DRAFT_135882 [Colletotrichum caudatum]|nr:hypothetical protein LY76DRAFT_135882 [Colletotrichum caudatum]
MARTPDHHQMSLSFYLFLTYLPPVPVSISATTMSLRGLRRYASPSFPCSPCSLHDLQPRPAGHLRGLFSAGHHVLHLRSILGKSMHRHPEWLPPTRPRSQGWVSRFMLGCHQALGPKGTSSRHFCRQIQASGSLVSTRLDSRRVGRGNGRDDNVSLLAGSARHVDA